MTSKRWLLDRGDPRTVFIGSAVIAIVGLVVVPSMIAKGGTAEWFAYSWIVISIVQLIWLGWHLRKFLAAERGQRRDTSAR